MMSAVRPRPTASGLMIARVLSTAIRVSPGLRINLRRKFGSYFRFVFFFAGFFAFAVTDFFPADFGLDFDLCNTLASVLPISAGLCTVWIPAARMALYFSTDR